ncbi:TPA: DUF835 domain-containing protein [Candidatus Woesearchaeota archaeon]|nr:DUF835 domain-containing protein [Candidatus Woesearchaeota archaeon]
MTLSTNTRHAVVITILMVLMATPVLAYHPDAFIFVMGLSFIAFLVKLGLAMWVYLRNPSAKVNRYFGIVFVGQAVWDLGKFMMWQIDDPAKALIWSKVSYTGYIISLFFFLLFIWAYLKKKNLVNSTKAGQAIFFTVLIALIVLLWSTGMVIEGLAPRPEFAESGKAMWAYAYGPVYNYFFLWFQILPFLYGLFLFALKYFSTKLEDKKKQVLYVMIGSSFPIIIGIPTGIILPALGIVLPPHNNLLTLIMTIFITVGIVKYKFLAIQPIGEQAPRRKISEDILREFRMDHSNYYMIRHKDSEEISYKMLLNYLAQDHYGLIITAKHPEKIRTSHGVKTTPIVWITDSETEHLSVDPVDIEQMYETVRIFCQKVKNPFVMIDGIDYLIHHNNFHKILYLVEEMKAAIEKSGGVLIIPEGKLELEPNQERMIYKELTLLPYSKSDLKAREGGLRGLAKKFKTFKHIILGFTPVTESLLAELEKEGIKPTIVTTEKIHHHIPKERLKVVTGNPLSKSMLIKAGVLKSNTLVMITMQEDSEAILAINKVRQLSETIMVVTNINNKDFNPIALKAGANYVVPSSSIGGRLISLTLCAPNAVRWVMDATTLSNKAIELVDVTVGKKDFFTKKTVKKADDTLGKAANIVAVENEKGLHKIPDDSYELKEGDKLVLIANLNLINKKTPEDIRKALAAGRFKTR